MNHPRMTFRGRRIAFLIAIGVAIALPKQIPCTYPGEDCGQVRQGKTYCNQFETEPLGVYLLELALGSDVGLSYSKSLDCY